MNSQSQQQYIAPIAIDVGASHTGVFRALYERGTCITEIEDRLGEVLTLGSGNYTLLMRDRTAKRHMRRGFDRRKMAKRLLMLVLKEHFEFPAGNHHQALGFLMNRRGFTFLEESYDAEALDVFPETAWSELPETVKKKLESREQIRDRLEQLIKNDPAAIGEIHTLLFEQTIQPVKNKRFVLGYVKKLQTAIDTRDKGETIKEGNKARNKLSQTPRWVIDTLIEHSVSELKKYQSEDKTIDLLAALNQAAQLDSLRDQLVKVRQKLQGETSTVWAKVDPANFDLEKNAKKLADKKTVVEAHLNNLVYAIHKANEELASGSRHRRKYFEEIQAEIRNASNHPHKYMQHLAAAIKDSDTLDEDKFYRIIAHISNLELKPLRAYFNDKAHRKGDQWQPEKLAKIVSRWFLKQWRVNEEKDGKEKVAQYAKLRKAWKSHTNPKDVVAFWLQTDPELTIPPYQSQTNRHPPYCQSLILNLDYMNSHYPNWRGWLDMLDTTQAPDLSIVTRRKNNIPLANDDQRKLRQLQFLLDRSQKSDPYKLNLIWSQYHRYQKGGSQGNGAKTEMEDLVKSSSLPDKLKKELTTDSFNNKQSFGHFINKYYQSRRKARDGRYFLHPENAGHLKPGKLDDHNKMLTLCPHRPRQKRHQMLLDFAAIVGLAPTELDRKLNGQDLEDFLRGIKGLPGNTENAAKAQKKHRGELKLKLQQGRDTNLNALADRIENLAIELAAKLWPELDAAEQQHKAKRFNSLFSFAQIHNIVFRDRSGFSSTCPVCSADNAGRMVEDSSKNVLASRLPALSMRLIDGAVKRLLEYKANEIARRHWALIEPKLKNTKVCVPLILEQNRFEFEPTLKKLKGRKPDDTGNAPAPEEFDEKETRIKQASAGICPYTGTSLSDNGELDHIIPRASSYGTLNDEANLIYVSTAANRSRSNQAYYLKDLADSYKQKQFATADDNEIRNNIYQSLTGKGSDEYSESTPFIFGNYLSFVNLDDDQKKAFRHALFLADNDPLKQRVIRALQNRNRTFVNGTQRFFAQLIADKLHERARKIGKQGKLSFDYFEYPADPRHPKGVQNLRGVLGAGKPKFQDDYSHHVDAHMAFLLACDDHRGEGSMGVDFGNIASVWPYDDGDITAYKKTQLGETLVESVTLARKKSKTGDRPHRQYHRDNFYADRYLPLWLIPGHNGITVKKGFSPVNSVDLTLSKKTAKAALKSVANFASKDAIRQTAKSSGDWETFMKQIIGQSGDQPVYISWSRNIIEQHCVKYFSAKSLAEGTTYSPEVDFIRSLAYQTQKKTINSPQDIEEALTDKETCKGGIELPSRQEWQRLYDGWSEAGKPEKEEFREFIKKWFLKHKHGSTASHKKVRQVFSLPVYNENAHYLQMRSDLYGNPVYQLIADSDSRKDGNKFKRPVLGPGGELTEVINPAFASPRMFKLKKDKIYSNSDYKNIDPNRWYVITQQQAEDAELNFPPHVTRIEYLIDNVTRPKIRLEIDLGTIKQKGNNLSQCVESILNHDLIKPKDENEKEKLRRAIKAGSGKKMTTPPYIGSGFNRSVKQVLAIMLKDK